MPISTGGGRREGGREVPRDRSVEILIGPGHPRVAVGTFDAAALLAELLSVLEPRIETGLGALCEALGEQGVGSDTARAARSMGKQIADSVRAGVVEGMRVRERHLAQLAVIDRAAAHASSLRELRDRIETELKLAGLQRVIEPGDLSAFNLARSNEETAADAPPTAGDAYEVLSPAYLDTETNRTIESGWLRPLGAGFVEPPPRGKEHGSHSRRHPRGEASETRHVSVGDRERTVPDLRESSASPNERPAADHHDSRLVEMEAEGAPSEKLPLRQAEGVGEEAPPVSPAEGLKSYADQSMPHVTAARGGGARSANRAIPPLVRAYAAKLRGPEQAGKSDHADDKGDQ